MLVCRPWLFHHRCVARPCRRGCAWSSGGHSSARRYRAVRPLPPRHPRRHLYWNRRPLLDGLSGAYRVPPLCRFNLPIERICRSRAAWGNMDLQLVASRTAGAQPSKRAARVGAREPGVRDDRGAASGRRADRETAIDRRRRHRPHVSCCRRILQRIPARQGRSRHTGLIVACSLTLRARGGASSIRSRRDAGRMRCRADPGGDVAADSVVPGVSRPGTGRARWAWRPGGPASLPSGRGDFVLGLRAGVRRLTRRQLTFGGPARRGSHHLRPTRPRTGALTRQNLADRRRPAQIPASTTARKTNFPVRISATRASSSISTPVPARRARRTLRPSVQQ